jgi:hypothetical protein
MALSHTVLGCVEVCVILTSLVGVAKGKIKVPDGTEVKL